MKRRFAAFIGIIALVMGLRLYDNGLLSINQAGKLTVFMPNGVELVYENKNILLLDRFSYYTRLDTVGCIDDALIGLADLNAKVLWTEQVEDITIIYAYCPFINKSETVHNKKVNVMVAVKDNSISYGCPLLKGSF